MKWHRDMRAALILTLALVSSSCGYALAGRGSFLPDYIRVVGIPPIENRSTYQQVELVLTEKIRTEFIGRGKYTVVAEATGTDAVLSGEITGISAQPIAFNESQLASRYLFIMTMKVQLTDTRTNMVLWSNDALTFREESELTTRSASNVIDAGAFLDQERSSFDRIATDVARTVVTAILEAF
jgi:lipopolysaccharide assembly LptE-like protein